MRRLSNWVRRVFRRRPQPTIRRRPKSPGPRIEALESRDPTGNLVGGLVAAALGGQLFEPLELMARAVGDWALLGGGLPGGDQASSLSPGATATFSALPATNGSLSLAASRVADAQAGSGRAGRAKSFGDSDVSISLPAQGLSEDSLWVGTAPSDLSGEVPASAPPGLSGSSAAAGAGIGVSSGMVSIPGGTNGTADGIAGTAGNSSTNPAFEPAASTNATRASGPGATSTTPGVANTTVLSPRPAGMGVPAPAPANSGGALQPTALSTTNPSAASDPATPANAPTNSNSAAPVAAAAPAVAPSLVTGSDAGGTATVKVLDPATGAVKLSFAPYGNSFTGGVRVAAADLNADGVADVITAPGHGGGSQIRVFDGKTGKAFKGTLGSFNAFAAGASDGVFVAAGDVNGDGKPDIVVGTEGGAANPAVEVFNGANGALLRTITLDKDFSGGARVAAGDVNGDGKADIIVAAGPGGPPRVEVFDGSNGKPFYDFFAFEPNSRDGVYVAAGDLNGVGKADIIAGDGGSRPEVRVFSGADLTTRLTFPAFDSTLTGGVRVGVTDADGDGRPDIAAISGPGGGEVRLFNGRTGTQIRAATPYGTVFHDGAFMAGTPGPAAAGGISPLVVLPVVTITGTPGRVIEGGQFIFTISRDDTSSQLTVFIAAGGTASPGEDYTPPPTSIPVFAAGQSTLTFVYTSLHECEFEGDQTVVWTIQPSPDHAYTVGTPGSATVVIAQVGPPTLVPEPQNGLVQEAPGVDETPNLLSPSGVRYADGAVQITLPDFIPDGSCSCSTDPLGLRRDWSGGVFVPDGTFGNGVVPLQLPYLLQDCEGHIAAVTTDTSARVFDRVGVNQYSPRFFLQEQLTRDEVTGEFGLADTEGNMFVFYGFGSGVPVPQRGQLKTLTDAGGNVTTATYNSDGTPAELSWAITTGGVTTTESLLFAYAITDPRDPNYRRVTSAQLRRMVGTGSWEPVRTVEYSYYNGTDNGDAGDLKTTVVKDASGVPFDTSYYRYYVTGSSNPTPPLKYVFGPDSLERLKAAFPTTWQTASDADVAPYADLSLTWNGTRVGTAVVQGKGCSACSGGLGTYTYSYTTSGFADGYNSWRTKTTETLPDGNQNIVYTNFAGQIMLAIYQDTTSGQQWLTYYQYDSSGRLLLKAEPSAVSGYDDTRPDLMNNQSGNYQYLRDGAGLIETNSYYSGTTATLTQAGGVAGYLYQTGVQRGELGTSVLQSTTQYFKLGSLAVVAPVATQTVYRNTDGTGGETTSYAYTYFGGTRPQSVTVTYPTISAAQNGPGTADSETTYFDVYGHEVWSKDADGFITYTARDATGAVLKTITDVDTTRTTDFTGLPSGWTAPTGGGLHLITQYEVDALGRVTKETSPAGNVTYVVYNDANQEVRVYQGWDSSTNTPTGPTVVQRHDRVNNYIDQLTMTATPAVSGGRPTGAEAISGVQTLNRSAMNAAGQTTDVYEYFNLTGLSYGTALVLAGATENTNYYRTRYQYDHRGRLERTQTPSGTIYRTVYDGLGRVVSHWVGTNDAPGSGFWSPDNNTSPSNLVKVDEYVYDGGGVGDSNWTKTIEHPGGGAADRETDVFYDWRDRLVAAKAGVQGTEDTATHRPIGYLTYDNLSEVIRAQQYDGDGVIITDANGDAVPDAPSASLLRAQADTAYDDQGRVYLSTVYSVNPSTGAVSSTGLTTNTWYNHRGEVVKVSQPGGLVTKSAYDGAGRQTVRYTTDGGGPGASWLDALNVIGDAVLEQTETQYDADSNPILVTMRERFHDETATGALGDPTTGPKARVSYQAMYYDAANRLIHSVDVGTDGGSAYTRPTAVPDRSDAVLVTDYSYNAAGWMDTIIDPKGFISKAFYDNLGRVTKSVEDYTDGVVTDTSNKTVEYTYDGVGDMLTVQADLTGGAYQRTQYVYGASAAAGDAITSNDLLKEVRYPDPTTGAPSSSLKETYTLNALGEVVTATDRNGNVHTYTYDVLGRLTSDTVTTLGAGVDGSVRRIEVAYDTQGNAYLITSYDAASGGNIVNQVQRNFNALGQLTAEYQSHAGAVNTGTTPKVQYTYSEMAGSANHSRPTSIIYPNGRVLTFDYAAALNDSISRLSALKEGVTTLESYDYLGLGTVVRRSHPQPAVDLTYIKQTGESNGDAGDQYTGLDRFGRIVDQRWIKTSTGTATDRFQYGYDRDSNRTYRDNLINTGFGEVYTYDSLNQLSSFQRGMLNVTKNGVVGTASRLQSWNFDAAGNWDSVTSDGSTQTRTANAQNEITSVSGATTPIYDANGNLTKDETGKQFVYDAWNRLITVKDASNNVIASYKYDGLGRRLSETKSGATRDFYYSDHWQVLEERISGQAQIQYVWSPVYVDTLVLRDRDADSNGSLEERLWAQQDANLNITTLTDGSGGVVERFAYDPFGSATVYDAGWGVRTAGSAYGWVHLHQGLRYDKDTGLYDDRGRPYSPTQGRFLCVDPLRFGAGDVNLYRYVTNGPTGRLDPSGLDEDNPLLRIPPKEFKGDPFDPLRKLQQGDQRAGITIPPEGPIWADRAMIDAPWLVAQGMGVFALWLLDMASIPGIVWTRAAMARGWTIKRINGKDVLWNVAKDAPVSGKDMADLIREVQACNAAKGAKGISSPRAAKKYLEGRWDQGTFGSVWESIEHHWFKHGQDYTLFEYTQLARKAWNNAVVVEIFVDKHGKRVYWVESQYGKGWFTPDGKILSFIPAKGAK
jgi:RHS repeat-associated protein